MITVIHLIRTSMMGSTGTYFLLIVNKTDIFVKKNKSNLQYSIANNKKDKEYFFRIDNSQDGLEAVEDDERILTIYFRADDTSTEYSRINYTIFDALAKIGGFFKIVVVIFQYSLLLFIESLFVAKLANRIYQTEKHHESVYLTESSHYETDSDQDENLIHKSSLRDNKKLVKTQVYNNDKKIDDQRIRKRNKLTSRDFDNLDDSKENVKDLDDNDHEGGQAHLKHHSAVYFDHVKDINRGLQSIKLNSSNRTEFLSPIIHNIKHRIYNRHNFSYGIKDILHYFAC